MVKLIVSDIDGTLLPYGRTALEPSIFPIIQELDKRGIRFCPASGRQYHSLRSLFEPVADKLFYMCENGAVIYGPGLEGSAPILGKVAMPKNEALELAYAITNHPSCDVLISGANTSYVCGCNEEYIDYMSQNRGNLVVVLRRLEDVPEDILKVSAYCPNGTEVAASTFGPRWGKFLNMAQSGPDWLDFSLADKGIGFKKLCSSLGVSLQDTVAFGDNWNDAPMLKLAGSAYLLDGADSSLLRLYPNSCSSVLNILVKLLSENTEN